MPALMWWRFSFLNVLSHKTSSFLCVSPYGKIANINRLGRFKQDRPKGLNLLTLSLQYEKHTNSPHGFSENTKQCWQVDVPCSHPSDTEELRASVGDHQLVLTGLPFVSLSPNVLQFQPTSQRESNLYQALW